MAYNRYMRGMSNGGSIFSPDHSTPLTDAELRAHVPSLFATEAHESRSDRFIPLPTVDVLDALRGEGYMPVFAQQAKTRVPGKAEFTRHMLRMRHVSLTATDGTAFEVIISNANDGTSAYGIMAGLFRFVCLNGLFVGEAFESYKVRHMGAATIDGVVNAALNTVQRAPEVFDRIETFKGITLDRAQALAYAEEVHRARFPRAYVETDNGETVLDSDLCPVNPLDLLRARRSADAHPTLWHALNIVQENVIKGGQRGMIRGKNGWRRAKVRAVHGLPESERVNRAVWDAADRAALLAA